MFILPKVESFGEQLAKNLGSGSGQSSDFITDLMKIRRQKESDISSQLLSQTHEMAKNEGRTVPFEESQRLIEQAKQLSQGPNNPLDIQKKILGQLSKNQNERSSIEENIVPDTIWEDIKAKFTGKDTQLARKKLEQQMRKSKYSDPEKAAMLIKKLGYEEAQNIISPLSDSEKQILKNIPKFQRVHGYEADLLSEDKKGILKNYLRDIYQRNPAANPISLRAELEKKGVNWKDFLNVYEDLKDEGLVQLPDNSNFADMENHLYKPPMGPLRQLFRNAKLVVR